MADFLKNLSERLNQPLTIDRDRWIAVSILLGLITLILLFGIWPLISATSEDRERAEDLNFRLARLQKIVAEKPSIMATRQQLTEASQNDEYFLPRETGSLAAANLQTLIKETVSEAEGELTSTQALPERTEDKFTRITVKVRMNGRSDILKSILHKLESSKPYLLVDNLNIRPVRMPRNPADKSPLPPERLSIDFDVSGYMKGAGP